MMTPAPSPDEVRRLAAYYRRNGYERQLDRVRRKAEGQFYKKGAEVRLVANSLTELDEIRRLLRRCGFKATRPFIHGKQWRQPVYGIDAVARFLKLVARPKARTTRVRRSKSSGEKKTGRRKRTTKDLG
jgi:hypothetical protein